MIFTVTAYLNLILVYTKQVKPITKFNYVKNISDENLMENLDSFINYNGLRQGDLRRPPKYYAPGERALNLKIIDMMKQAIYDTQDKMKDLDPVLEKYRDDPSTKMAFIFNRLKQLIIDIRRIYTLALKWQSKRRMFEQVVWYSHCLRKYVDIMYMVDYLIDSHMEYARIFDKG